jgi:DNA-binding HxlR family transcriptional regulator
MSSDEMFEAVSHPIRIDIVRILAEKPLGFADLKRELKISSSGLLDFHLKKLDELIAINKEGRYSLTEKGFAALTTIEGAAGYYRLRSAQKRSFFLASVVSVFINIGTLWVAFQTENYVIWYALVLPVTLAWSYSTVTGLLSKEEYALEHNRMCHDWIFNLM